MARKRRRFPFFLPVALLLLWLLGPKAQFEPLTRNHDSTLPVDLQALETWIQDREGATEGLKPDNQARIHWADSVRRTPWSVVYIHGWSASPREGDPIHRRIAQRYGANLYLARLPEHGIAGTEALGRVTPAELTSSAAEAVAIGRLLGDRVLLMSTSTGGTLSLWMASDNPDVDALVLYSPNIRVADSKASLVNGPWGLKLVDWTHPDGLRTWEATDSVQAYWSTSYDAQAVVALQDLVEKSMQPKTWEAVTQPTFVGVWYRDKDHQDDVVSVAAAHKMFDRLGTPDANRQWVDFDQVEAHGLASSYFSKDLESVEIETSAFLEEVLGWEAVAGLRP